MTDARFVALLRGINVGGRNRVSMPDLRASVEKAGYAQVSTYIQSGNVLFSAQSDAPGDVLEADLEAAFERHLGLPLTVVVRSHHELRQVVLGAPEGFGEAPEVFHSDAVFLKHTLATADAMDVVRLREGVDAVWPADGVLYFRRLAARRSESRMSSIVGTPAYRQMTIRSWATTTKLLALLEASTDPGSPG